ncbi:MAG: acyl-CoA thioesterase [Rikenellaceae bacterium]|nr:acyl-CoA thioesterase [Rikenellaceae bacterium]
MIITPIQIRFADIDALGHVNNVNLQHFFDQGKVDYMQRVLGLSGVWRKEGFVQARTETDYLAQVFMEENICVRTTVSRLGNKSLTFSQQIYDADTGQIKAASVAVNVAFDFETQRSVAISDKWRQAIEEHGIENFQVADATGCAPRPGH